MTETLLDQIIHEATWGDQPTSSIIKAVSTLGSRIGEPKIVEWAQSELTGNFETLPKYRANIQVPVIARWAGPGGIRDDEIHMDTVDSTLHNEFEFTTEWPVARLEEVVKYGEPLSERITDMCYGIITSQIRLLRPIYSNKYVIEAHKEVGPAVIAAIVDQIRARAAQLAAELQAANPKLGQVSGPKLKDVQKGREIMSNVFNFNNTYNAPIGATAQGQTANAYGNNNVQYQTLVNELETKNGLSAAQAHDLATATQKDGWSIGVNVNSWLQGVRDGLIEIGSGATVEQIVSTVQQILG